ncbi:unnamed protein product [Miscanthus lutarioriparius]|uniref:BHLH domain-containing protein n=1 Tax=Miscanthus lutarioriparius TaxID=422564 RepID=A0A811PH14_9POAL|nr:unnamed protein product [Miscanthus lutarioriparius]
MALKNHSEAERRRRERINAHLATLRTMVPCSDKMDKAALLAEVITHVKKLKATAARIRDHCAVPADADDVAVELVQGAPPSTTGGVLVKATLSCADGADVFAEVKHALRPLRLSVVGSEVTTLGGRVRFTFVIMSSSSSCGNSGGGDVGAVVASVHQALQSVDRQGQLRARVRAEGVASQQAPEGLHVRVLQLLFLNLDRSDRMIHSEKTKTYV